MSAFEGASMDTNAASRNPYPIITRSNHARSAKVIEAIVEALTEYEDMLNNGADLRAVTIDVKLRNDGRGVRTVIISLQGEVEFTVR